MKITLYQNIELKMIKKNENLVFTDVGALLKQILFEKKSL